MVRLFNVSAWSPHPELTDGVVHLTSFRDGDAPTMVEWNHEADIARWFDFPPLPPERKHLDHVRGVIADWHEDYIAGSRIAWAVRHPTTGGLLGAVELRPREDGGADASYTTHPAHRRRGFATRALRLACVWAFDHGLDRVVVEYDARNVASAHVARAAGFVEIERRPGGMTYEHGESPGDSVIAELRPLS
jgi:RimJ/RimL family protein N-acetyltransferase